MNLRGIYTIIFTDCPQFWGGQTDLADPGAQPSKSWGRSRKSLWPDPPFILWLTDSL